MSEQNTSSNTMNIRVTIGKKEDNLKNILNKIDAEKRALFCKEALVQHVLNIKNGSVISAYVDKLELMSDEEKKLANAVTMEDLKDLFNSLFANAQFVSNNKNTKDSNNNQEDTNDDEEDEDVNDNNKNTSSTEINKATYSFTDEDDFLDDDALQLRLVLQ